MSRQSHRITPSIVDGAQHAGEQVEQVLFHLIDLDTLLAPSNKEDDAAKKVALREELAHGPLLTWFGALEV